MKMIVTNKASEQYSLAVPLADGTVITELIDVGDRCIICNIDPYDINTVNLLKDEVFTTKKLCVEFVCDARDLVGLGLQRVYDEGTEVPTGICLTEMDFVGDGVTATSSSEGRVTVTISGTVGGITPDRFKSDVHLGGTLDGVNRVFTTPDKFVEGTIGVIHNGTIQSERVGTSGDYLLSESGGVGTGFDTITFCSLIPKATSRLRAFYITDA